LDLDRGVLRGSPAIASGNLVIGSDDGWLIGVSLSRRESIWEKDLGRALLASAVTAGSEVLIAPNGCSTIEGTTARTYYRAVNPANGDLQRVEGVC
jgi:outer membrane protein assembly factor BamB